MTYSQIWWPILEIRAPHLPIQVHTHPEQWAAIYAAAPGEQLGVLCLAQGHLVVVLKVKRALYIHLHSLPPPIIPAGPRLELATFRLFRLSNH